MSGRSPHASVFQPASPSVLATRSAMAHGLRPGEPALGNLCACELAWLAQAHRFLQALDAKRSCGRPGHNAFCIFEMEEVYVQFLARHSDHDLVAEAVSARSHPQIAARLTPERDKLLQTFGFEPPAASPNYAQRVTVGTPADLAYAARLAFRTLRDVYGATGFYDGNFILSVPPELPGIPLHRLLAPARLC